MGVNSGQTHSHEGYATTSSTSEAEDGTSGANGYGTQTASNPEGTHANTTEAPPNIPHLVGNLLKQARERSGIPISTISDRLKWRPYQISALEKGEWESLPPDIFLRGIVRNYAQIVGLNEAIMIDYMNSRASTADFVPKTRGGKSIGHSDPRKLWGGLSIMAILLLGGYILYQWEPPQEVLLRRGKIASSPQDKTPFDLSSASSKAPSPSEKAQKDTSTTEAVKDETRGLPAPAATPPVIQENTVPAAPSTPAPPSPLAGEAGNIRLVLSGESWIDIRDLQGKLLVSRSLPNATDMVLNGQPPLSVVIGNATLVQLYYKGKLIDLKPYTQGTVARFDLK